MATTAGGLPYVESSDLISGYPTVSQALAEELDDQLAAKLDTSAYSPGLSHIVTTAISSATSVSVDNAFDSTYDNYLVVFRVSQGTAATIGMRMRASSTDDTSSNYYNSCIFGTSWNGVVGNTGVANNNAFSIAGGTTTIVSAKCYSPALATPTALHGGWTTNTGGNSIGGWHNVSTAYDGLTVYSANAMTGSISIYGLSEA